MGLVLRSVPEVMKAALRVVYPPQCPGCAAPVGTDGALCPDCWLECGFVTGCSCDRCGAPLPSGGDAPVAEGAGAELLCDGCLATARPWEKGRAALVYQEVGRRLVLALKHGDRPDLAVPLGGWLACAAAPLAQAEMVVMPIPVHPRRMLRRKYNQAALLAGQVARRLELPLRCDVLRRQRATPSQDHRSLAERFQNQQGAFAVAERERAWLRGRPVLLVDDVMASGATMTAATEALLDAGACTVSVAVLARAVIN